MFITYIYMLFLHICAMHLFLKNASCVILYILYILLWVNIHIIHHVAPIVLIINIRNETQKFKNTEKHSGVLPFVKTQK